MKKPNFGTPKMEKALFVDETKIGLCGVPLHTKGHAREMASFRQTMS
jgi:hypothetical protein